MIELLVAALKAVFIAAFGSLWNRLFPVKTAADEKADILTNEVKILNAEANAVTNAPSTATAMEVLLRDGKL